MKPKARLFLSIFALLLLVLSGSWLMMDNQAVADPDPEAPAGSVNDMVVVDDPLLDDNTQKNEILMKLIYEGLTQVHYQPLSVNNEFSEKAYDLYLKRIDFNKRFLTQSDVDELNKWRLKIDDEIMNLSYEFFDVAYDKQVDRENQFKDWYEEMLAEPFDFIKDEMVIYDGENIEWAADEAELTQAPPSLESLVEDLVDRTIAPIQTALDDGRRVALLVGRGYSAKEPNQNHGGGAPISLPYFSLCFLNLNLLFQTKLG